MNVFQITLVFISFVTANGNFPAVIFLTPHQLTQPTILPLSDTEVEVGFDYRSIALYIACPLDHNKREKDAIPEVLVRRKIVTAKQTSYLDELPLCELQPQVTFEQAYEKELHSLYQIGYKVYDRRTEDDDDSSRLYSSHDTHTIGEVFRVNYNTGTKKTTSVQHYIDHSRFIPTASNRKHTFVYEKNEEFLGIDLDFLYQNFVDQILPQLLKEKSRNQLAHALGIQKVQLAPQGDFPLDTWKVTTYWNINTVPIWRVLLLRWNAIEIYLRKLHKRGIYITVETGAGGALELAERYYENDTVPKLHIPKYVWKLIPDYSYHYNTAIVIIMHNDPFTEHQQPLCEDICAINGWLISNNDYRTGLVYCCKMTINIAQILNCSNDMRSYEINTFTKDKDGTEDLDTISRILSDPREKLYDW